MGRGRQVSEAIIEAAHQHYLAGATIREIAKLSEFKGRLGKSKLSEVAADRGWAAERRRAESGGLERSGQTTGQRGRVSGIGDRGSGRGEGEIESGGGGGNGGGGPGVRRSVKMVDGAEVEILAEASARRAEAERGRYVSRLATLHERVTGATERLMGLGEELERMDLPLDERLKFLGSIVSTLRPMMRDLAPYHPEVAEYLAGGGGGQGAEIEREEAVARVRRLAPEYLDSGMGSEGEGDE